MKLIRRLKQAILDRMLKRPAVLNAALGKAINDPAILNRALQNNGFREKIFDAASEQKSTAQEILRHPVLSKQIPRNPAFFEAMLRGTVTHPEVLVRIFEQRGVQTQLVAQKSFLQTIAYNPELMKQIVALVPKKDLQETAAALFSPYQSAIVVDKSTDTDFALTLLSAIDPESQRAGNTLTSILQEHMQENLPALLSILTLRDPDVMSELLMNPNLRKPLLQALPSDIETLLSILRNYAINSKDAPKVALRITRVFDEIMSESVVTRAFANDVLLRNAILARLDDLFSSIGESLEENLPQARATLAGTAVAKKDKGK